MLAGICKVKVLNMEFKLREVQKGFALGRTLLSPSPLKERGQVKGECLPRTSPYLARDVRWIKNQKGQTLIEVLIAVAILGIVAVAFLSALTSASRAVIIGDERTTAESLIRSELEYVRSQEFSSPPWSYNVSATSYSTDYDCEADPDAWVCDDSHRLSSDEYSGYCARVLSGGHDADGDDIPDAGISEITVEVYHSENPNPDDWVLSTTTYKVFL